MKELGHWEGRFTDDDKSDALRKIVELNLDENMHQHDRHTCSNTRQTFKQTCLFTYTDRLSSNGYTEVTRVVEGSIST